VTSDIVWQKVSISFSVRLAKEVRGIVPGEIIQKIPEVSVPKCLKSLKHPAVKNGLANSNSLAQINCPESV
jgi:hypothetical protein